MKTPAFSSFHHCCAQLPKTMSHALCRQFVSPPEIGAQCTSRSSMFLLCKSYLKCRLQVLRLKSSCWWGPLSPHPCRWETNPRPELSQNKGPQEAANRESHHADTCCHHQSRAEKLEKKSLGQKRLQTKQTVMASPLANSQVKMNMFIGSWGMQIMMPELV